MGSSLLLTLISFCCILFFMSRPLRIEYPNAWYHVINRGQHREPIFTESKDYFSFLETVRESSEIWHLRVAAYCLMPNHHLLVQTPQGNLSRCMRHIDGVYTQRFNRRHGSDGPLFRGRYKALLIEADTYLLQLLRYIHRNPLRAGLVKNLDSYTWSSHRGYVSNQAKWKWLHKETVLALLSENSMERSGAYRKYVACEDEKGLIGIFSQEKWPAIIGSERFISMLKQNFFPQKVVAEVPQSKELSPKVDRIIGVVAGFYRVNPEELARSHRGCINEARNVSIYLVRKLRGDTLAQIGSDFGIDKYSSVSSVINRMKAQVAKDRVLREKVEELVSMIIKSQEQT